MLTPSLILPTSHILTHVLHLTHPHSRTSSPTYIQDLPIYIDPVSRSRVDAFFYCFFSLITHLYLPKTDQQMSVFPRLVSKCLSSQDWSANVCLPKTGQQMCTFPPIFTHMYLPTCQLLLPSHALITTYLLACLFTCPHLPLPAPVAPCVRAVCPGSCGLGGGHGAPAGGLPGGQGSQAGVCSTRDQGAASHAA